jgi:hypothetical protein
MQLLKVGQQKQSGQSGAQDPSGPSEGQVLVQASGATTTSRPVAWRNRSAAIPRVMMVFIEVS